MFFKACSGYNPDGAIISFLASLPGVDAKGTNNDGETPLFKLANDDDKFSQFVSVFEAINDPSVLTAKTNDGKTFAHEAAKGGAIRILKWLFEKCGADFISKSVDNEKKTPLMVK